MPPFFLRRQTRDSDKAAAAFADLLSAMEVLPEALMLGKSSQFIPYVSIDYLWVPVGSFVLLVAVEIHPLHLTDASSSPDGRPSCPHSLCPGHLPSSGRRNSSKRASCHILVRNWATESRLTCTFFLELFFYVLTCHEAFFVSDFHAQRLKMRVANTEKQTQSTL